MPENSGSISLVGIKKTYFPHHRQQVPVLKGVDLTIKKGGTLAIVGASGVGKSTLLHIMGALDKPTSGHVYYGDLDIFSLDDSRLAEFRNRKIGFVFQFHHLLPEFTALENTMMPALVARIPTKQASERAQEILDKVGLGARLNHKPGELSGGEQQRVALARALMLTPDILLADEPTGNLDERTGEQVFALLLELNREQNITTIVVTHNRRLADFMTSEVTLLDGVIQEIRQCRENR
jgi:lipoprotein-releasing system ATP-binding protein